MKVLEKNKKKKPQSVETLFRNALRSNLELTALADSKASILISVNGFILTVIVTASGLQMNHPLMVYPFIAIIITALGSISFATKAIQPRYKEHLIKKKHQENYQSILYFQDMASLTPEAYLTQAKEVILTTEATQENILKHLHILGAEIKIKYRWLRQAYNIFAVGLILSMILVVYALLNMTPEGL
ncbi:MAG: Metal-dependent phosphohydrolase, HD subdomain [uncultured Sulfurovum sp.]|uniref:Metal-dependent phosphohydrolase, HD subdomain n=1 Tax=uncultured Sulfurovum sp. TaxID=269237 RepID=A0A6S6TPX0_9BACT|nr:MAG: Metal-dependent phosphohydrolase, HD subdomain [uncultured Sulfurovum sp.]